MSKDLKAAPSNKDPLILDEHTCAGRYVRYLCMNIDNKKFIIEDLSSEKISKRQNYPKFSK
jgi:hypothetical protein